MKNNKIYLALLIAFSSTSVMADNQSSTFKASSILTATCTLSANSVNFGAFMLPLSSQSAGSSLSMLCSNKAPYTIDLSYGGVYGQGSQGDGTYWTYKYRASTYYKLYAKHFPNGSVIEQWIENGSLESVTGCTIDSTNPDRCNKNGTPYDYGMMTGAAKGDSVAYSIFVPGDNSKVWNSGKNSYSGIGSGQEEQITFQAKIVPAQSGSSYPTPDFYMDTVTATVTY